MKYAVVFSSKTGNTKRLAEAIRAALGEAECIYFGPPDPKALEAPRLYVGFWTDKGTCDADSAAFLSHTAGHRVFLFGTAGFGGSDAYFSKILASVRAQLPDGAEEAGCWMCQGRMPQAVRSRYEAMQAKEPENARYKMLIENFDAALAHPDANDLEAAAAWAKSCLA